MKHIESYLNWFRDFRRYSKLETNILFSEASVQETTNQDVKIGKYSFTSLLQRLLEIVVHIHNKGNTNKKGFKYNKRKSST